MSARAPTGRLRRAAGIILRPSDTPRSVYLVDRNADLAFFGGYAAFVGGTVDGGDEAIVPADAPRHDDEPPAFLGAAARETFEETGVLVARGADRLSPSRQAQLRESLLAAPHSGASRVFREMLAAENLEIDARRFSRVCRMTTPPFTLVRYETVFYLVDLLPGESPSIVPGELVSGAFLDARDALARWRAGEMLIVPPAIILLTMLARADDAAPTEQFLDAARHLSAEYARGKIHQVYFTPGVRKLTLHTETRPPANHTNAYLVGERELHLVDPGATRADEQEKLFEALDEAASDGARVTAILLTHHHPDHVGAVNVAAARLGVPVWAHAETARALAGRIEIAHHIADGETISLGESPDGRPGWTLRAIHTPGHARGHLAFAESRYNALLAGDMVSTLSTIVIAPPEGHLATYLASLRRLRALPNGTLYPAHGPAKRDAHATIDSYLRHRAQREEKLLSAWAGAPAESRLSLDALLARAYDDVAADALPLARLSLAAGIEKLVEEGRVEATADGYALRTAPR
ncbi:MAG: MBL fold metallo-hydrolase [bacterium]